ncbi:MAG: hypothetical protein U9R79_08010 [Armatimonadota bacterium]|nr:hypothetical protein [Armatimonadota bacterium]
MAGMPAVLTRPALIAHEDTLYVPCPPEHAGDGPTYQVAPGPGGLLHFGYPRQMPRDGETLFRRYGLVPPTAHPERTHDEALPIVLGLAADLIRQWQRSRREGIGYDRLTPAPDAHAADGAHLPLSEPLATDPRLIWFGWVYELHPDEGGPVQIGGERYVACHPVRLHAWWTTVEAGVGRPRQQASGQTATVQPHPELVRALRERIRANEDRDATLFLDGPLHIKWCAGQRRVQFIMRFEAFALGDSRGTYYAFPAGSVVVDGDLVHVAAFAEAPTDIYIGTRVDMGRDAPLHPCVSTDGGLCTAGGINEICREGLSPAGTIIRVLELSVQVLLTGLGAPNAPKPYRSLKESGAPRMTLREANRRGIPVIPWRHHRRGMEVAL